MIGDFQTSARSVLSTVVVCCVLYPLGILVLAELAASQHRLGSLVYDAQGRPVGSERIAQAFTRPEYFWPRPSAVDYNAAAAGGSNLSPANPLLRERAEKILARLAVPAGTVVPADLVTASGSGLDPHITRTAALLQAPRVARSRNVPENEVQQLIEQRDEGMLSSASGEGPLVNVLLLNLALDRKLPMPAKSP